MRLPHVRAKYVILIACGVGQLLLAYYFLFLEKDFPVAKLGDRHEPPEAVLDSSLLPNEVTDVGAADWAMVPIDRHMDAERLENGIRAAGRFLCRKCDETGQFVYKLNLLPDIKHKPRYNVLRHAGTIYALTQFYDWQPSDETLRTLHRSTRFLKNACVGPVPDLPELLAVWSSPELTRGDHPVKAKLGGAGLALVALASFERIKPGSTSLAELRRLGEFILYMQKPDGSFYSRYIPSSGGRCDKWTSLYYPGEAALGLVMLYESDPDSKWLEAAAHALFFLAKTREGRAKVEADHWALLATARLLPLLDRCDSPLTEEIALAHVRQICRSILAEQQLSSAAGKALGGFAADGRVCPTATRLEGLQAALKILGPSDRELAGDIERSVQSGIWFLARAQVETGEHAGAVPRAISRLPRGHRYYSTSFNRRATEVRIDYVQHWLSAMIEFHTCQQTSSRRNADSLSGLFYD